METLNLLEEVLGAKFKFEKLSAMMDRNLGFMEKWPDSNPLNGRVPLFELRKKRPTIWSFWQIFGPHGDIPR